AHVFVGVLPLTFANPNDYDRLVGNSRIVTLNLTSIAPNTPVLVKVVPATNNNNGDTTPFQIELHHTLNEDQIAWFRAGSALNFIGEQTTKLEEEEVHEEEKKIFFYFVPLLRKNVSFCTT